MADHKTLFDPNFLSEFSRATGNFVPFTLAMEYLGKWKGITIDKNEESIFNQIVDHETHLYEHRGYVDGDLVIEQDGKEINLNDTPDPFLIPGWVEEDSLKLISSNAKAIVIVQHHADYALLHREKIWEKENCILVYGLGLPRHNTRRLLHRISNQFSIPVVLYSYLTTWGFLMFNLLKTGLMVPGDNCPQLAIEDLRHLGIKYQDCLELGIADKLRRKWKPIWDDRIEAMSRWPSMQDPEIHKEFERFQDEKLCVKSSKFREAIGDQRFIREYFIPRLRGILRS